MSGSGRERAADERLDEVYEGIRNADRTRDYPRGREHEGFVVNPDPLRVGPRHEGSAYKGVTREQRRRAWIATGNDLALFDAENPEPDTARERG